MDLKKKMRGIVEQILRDDSRPDSFQALSVRLARILREREGWKPMVTESIVFGPVPSDPYLEDDELLFLEEIYWDLFREKWITLSHNDTQYFCVHSESPALPPPRP
jgi:hypothetical protein